MFQFLTVRLLQFPLILAVIYLATFFLVWVAPGSPLNQSDRKLDPEVERRLLEEFHAESWQTFLAYYPAQLLQGDFGPSLYYNGFSVNEILASGLPISVTLGVFALTIAVFAGVGLGTLAAVNRGGFIDWLSLTVALVGISIPSFVVAAGLLIVFAAKLRWFPIGIWAGVESAVLPAIALSLLPMAYITRLMRVAMIDVLSSDYVRTARAKGLSKALVVWKHCLRNAFLPVMSYLGPATAATLTGSFVVEKVFNIPGLGQHFVNSILNRDQTLILGTVMVYSLFVLVFNLLVDLGYAWVDPRIDLATKGASA